MFKVRVTESKAPINRVHAGLANARVPDRKPDLKKKDCVMKMLPRDGMKVNANKYSIVDDTIQ